MLEIRNVSKSFGGLLALNRVSFHVERGSVTSLIGPNGSGKTTMLNLITRAFDPSGGAILLEGREITKLRPDQLVGMGIARTFQVGGVFRNLTALENVMIGAHSRTRASAFDPILRPHFVRRENSQVEALAREWLRAVNPEREISNAVVSGLTSTEQRAVELARACIGEPKLLLLDEPTAGMDAVQVKLWLRQLEALRGRGLTVLLVEHRMSLVMDISDKVVVLSFGCKIAEGPPETVARDPNVRSAYLGTQAYAGG